MLRAVGVSRSFEGVQALADVDLELARSEVVGLIGPNGAGKTTLVNVITGFDFPTTGRVELEERDVTRWSPQRRGRAGLARTFQHGHAFKGLTVRENVEVAALGVARALATEPRFVLMDEPAAGLTEAEVPGLAAVVRSVRDDHGVGVLLIDHNVTLILDVCDRIHVLDQGRTLAEGTPDEIRKNIDVANAYLGGSGRDV